MLRRGKNYMIPLIPPLDPSPAPGPIWVFKVLLYATFTLHLVFMNLLLGGTLLASYYGFKGKEKHLDAARSLVRILPFVMSYAISFGVAPLLFIQVLYGPLFYSATIPMGAPFLLIIPTLMAAYSLAYVLSWRWDTLGKIRPWLSGLLLGLLLWVGFTYSNAFTLMLDPERVKFKFLRHPGGWQMNLAEPTLVARFGHMFIGAASLAGLYVAYLGLKRLLAEPEQGRWMFRSGATWFSGAVILQIVSGFWWLFDLPKEQMMLVMGKSPMATAFFWTGFVAALAALVLLLRTLNALKPWRVFHAALGCAGITLLCMVVWRDILRDATVRPFLDPYALPTAPQWGALALFLGIFAGGIAALTWLLRIAYRAKKASAASAA
jgi:hypothetical protein